MNKLIDNILKFRWFIVILIPLLTIGISTNLKHLEFEGSYRIWFGEDSKILKDYDDFRLVFGNDDAISIIFKDENGILNKKALHVIQRMTKKLWATKYIARVDSLTNYQYIHADKEYPDDILIEDFIEDIDSLTEKNLQEKKEAILKEDSIIGRILSEDTKTTMIVARMTPKAGNDPEVSKKLQDAAQKIVDSEKESGYNFHLSGGPVLNMAFITLGEYDAKTFTPIVLLVSMILLYVIFRRPSGMFLSISVVIFTFLIVLSVQVLLGYRINNFTANMPIFVVAIGIADAMHLFWIYLIGRKKGLDNTQAIHYSVTKNFLPILFTSLTTAVGFASLGISDVIPIKTLGIATANAALLAFVLTILFVPAVLAIINPKIKAKEIHAEDDDISRHSSPFAKKYTNFIIKNDSKIILASFIIFSFIGIGISFVKVDSNTVRYFKEEVEFRKSIQFIQDNLTGPMAYEIVVDSKEKDGIKSPEFMRTVEKFYVDYKNEFSDVQHVSSLLDILKKLNEVMDNSKTIPNDKNKISQYLFFYTMSLPQGMEINDRRDVTERYFRITSSVNIVDTSLDLKMIKWIEAWWKNTPYTAKTNGQTVMFAHMQHDVTDTLIESILLAITAVSIMMILIFKNLKMLPLFIVPNILPIVLVVGAMGWMGITIDIGVAISGAIIIGVAVDDTIHFFVKYREARKRGDSLRESLEYVMTYAGSAIIFTTIILCVAFMVFAFSQFLPNVNFGIVTTIALAIAVLVDLVMLPAILSKLDSKEKSLLT